MVNSTPVIPSIYDEALSYGELISKLINKINYAFKEIDGIPDTIKDYLNTDEFKAWISQQVSDALTKSEFEVPLSMFGAVGDGVTDDTQAFVAALAVASETIEWITPYYWSNHTVKVALSLGNGRFLITKDNVFAVPGASSLWGLMVHGNGPFVSQLLYCPTSSNSDLHYFYKQNTDVCGLIAPSFQNMGFIIGSEYDANFFYLQSVAHNTSQGWYFNNCLFVGNKNAVLLTVTGDYNDSEMFFCDCRVREVKHVYYSAGSVENLFCTFTNTHLEHIYDDAFYITTASSVAVNNCSMLFSDDSKSGAAVLRMAGKTVTGGTYIFNNLRVELHGNSIIYTEDVANSPALIHFDNCFLGVVYTAGAKVLIHNNSDTKLIFTNCSIGAAPYGYETTTPFVEFIGTSDNITNSGSITFDNCYNSDNTYYYSRDNFDGLYGINSKISIRNSGCIDVVGFASRQGVSTISNVTAAVGYNKTVKLPSSVVIVKAIKLLGATANSDVLDIRISGSQYRFTFNSISGLYENAQGAQLNGGTWEFTESQIGDASFGFILYGRL